MTTPDPSSFTRNTHAARELCIEVIRALGPDHETASGALELRAAAEALEHADRDAAIAQARYLRVKTAITHLARALSSIHAQPELADSSESVARALALLYPVARAHQRQRGHVMLNPSLAPPPSSTANLLPRAPASPGDRDPGSFDGEDRRRVERVRVEADVGLLSQSHFYTGISRDLSRGGLLVATYQPKPPGTTVALYFVLPNGHTVHADGIVAWTSAASAECPPGMGIAFEHVAPEDATAIEQFCQQRDPLLHDRGDD